MRPAASSISDMIARHSDTRNQSMIGTDDMIASAIVAAGYRALTPDGVQRRFPSVPIDATAEPKSASVRLISCVHFRVRSLPESRSKQRDRPLQRGTIIAATHFCQKRALRWPARCVLEIWKSIFAPAAIEMQFDCVRMARR